MTTKVDNKDTKLAEILAEYFAKKMNLARIKFLGMFTYALCKVQTVGYEKLASAFEVLAKYESSLRRIQRFRAESALDTALIARLLFKLLPHKPHYRLALERTSWKFGEVNISVLTLAEAYQGVACPLLIAMLPKGGSSNAKERVAIMERYALLPSHPRKLLRLQPAQRKTGAGLADVLRPAVRRMLAAPAHLLQHRSYASFRCKPHRKAFFARH